MVHAHKQIRFNCQISYPIKDYSIQHPWAHKNFDTPFLFKGPFWLHCVSKSDSEQKVKKIPLITS